MRAQLAKILEVIQQAVVSSCAQGRAPAVVSQWTVWSGWRWKVGSLWGDCTVFAHEQECKWWRCIRKGEHVGWRRRNTQSLMAGCWEAQNHVLCTNLISLYSVSPCSRVPKTDAGDMELTYVGAVPQLVASLLNKILILGFSAWVIIGTFFDFETHKRIFGSAEAF